MTTKSRTVIGVTYTHSRNSEDGKSPWAGEVQERFLEDLSWPVKDGKDVNREGKDTHTHTTHPSTLRSPRHGSSHRPHGEGTREPQMPYPALDIIISCPSALDGQA